MFSRLSQNLLRSIVFATVISIVGVSDAQVDRPNDGRSARLPSAGDANTASPRPPSTATIHWQGVPLGETLDRLKLLFNDPVFVDRRVDPSQRVTLDMSASSAEQVLGGIADACGLDVARLGKLLYLGPASAAGRLRPLANLRSRDVVRLPADAKLAFGQALAVVGAIERASPHRQYGGRAKWLADRRRGDNSTRSVDGE